MAIVDWTPRERIPYELLFNRKPNAAYAAEGFNQSLPVIQQIAGMIQKQKDQQQLAQATKNLPPELQPFAQYIAKDPSLMGQLYPSIKKAEQQKPEWSAVSGMMSDAGEPLEIDKFTGQMKPVSGIKAVPTGGSQMAEVREKQFGLQDLPSNQSSQTAGGAAYQVKVAARQGKNLIARPGSPQRTALATGDLARAILRNAPTDETLKNGNFSDNLIQRWSVLKQKLTADPSAVSNPQIRREMYNIFDEMDKSATPFIKNQLDDMESMGFKVPPAVRKRQMGETLPDVPFVDVSSGTASSQSGWGIQRVP